MIRRHKLLFSVVRPDQYFIFYCHSIINNKNSNNESNKTKSISFLLLQKGIKDVSCSVQDRSDVSSKSSSNDTKK